MRTRSIRAGRAWPSVRRARRVRFPDERERVPARATRPPARPGIGARMWLGVRALWADWQAARCTRMSAALAFYAAFSLAPTLLLLLVLGSVFVDPAQLSRLIVDETGSFVGEDVAGLVSEVMRQSERPGKGWSAAFALALIVFGATTAMTELKESLDQVFSPGLDGETGLRGALRARTRAFVLILALTALLALSLLASTILAAAASFLGARLGWDVVVIGQVVSPLVTLAGAFVLCLVAFRALPARRLPWGALVYGAALATVLFAAGCAAVVLYVADSAAVGAFGPAGSLAILLLWLYYSTLAFLLGAVAARRRAIARGAPQLAEPAR